MLLYTVLCSIGAHCTGGGGGGGGDGGGSGGGGGEGGAGVNASRISLDLALRPSTVGNLSPYNASMSSARTSAAADKAGESYTIWLLPGRRTMLAPAGPNVTAVGVGISACVCGMVADSTSVFFGRL